MTIKELRKMTGMTQAEFGEYLQIPMRSIQNWENGARKCPDYLVALIEYRLTSSSLCAAPPPSKRGQ